MKAITAFLSVAVSLCVAAVPASCVAKPGSIAVDAERLVHYQAEPMSEPAGGDAFKGSNFIHPLKTPSGFVITDSGPEDHFHHFGLWWPWKHIEVDGRTINCWELQEQDGIVEARETRRIANGIVAKSHYIDRKAPGGPVSRIVETSTITTSGLLKQPARGYFLDVEISEETAREETITITPYRYSGFSIRCTPFWTRSNSVLLTSEGKNRMGSNYTKARWVLMQGDTGKDAEAGFLMMSHPDNKSHPEMLRTWEDVLGGIVYVNFNTVQKDPWVFEPGKHYLRKYRLFIFDGLITADQAEAVWEDFSESGN